MVDTTVEGEGNGSKKILREVVGVSNRLSGCVGVGETKVQPGVGLLLKVTKKGIPGPATKGIPAGSKKGKGTLGSLGGIVVVNGADPFAGLESLLFSKRGKGFSCVQEMHDVGSNAVEGKGSGKTPGQGEEGSRAWVKKWFPAQGVEADIGKTRVVDFVFPGRNMDLEGGPRETLAKNAGIRAHS